MGVVSNITINTFPKQGNFLDKRVEVCFHYDTKHTIFGTMVRYDSEDPWIAIIHLDDGRYVLATECQFSPPIPAFQPNNRPYWEEHLHD